MNRDKLSHSTYLSCRTFLNGVRYSSYPLGNSSITCRRRSIPSSYVNVQGMAYMCFRFDNCLWGFFVQIPTYLASAESFLLTTLFLSTKPQIGHFALELIARNLSRTTGTFALILDPFCLS